MLMTLNSIKRRFLHQKSKNSHNFFCIVCSRFVNALCLCGAIGCLLLVSGLVEIADYADDFEFNQTSFITKSRRTVTTFSVLFAAVRRVEAVLSVWGDPGPHWSMIAFR